jgi:outer membrane protein assembly factor BamA
MRTFFFIVCAVIPAVLLAQADTRTGQIEKERDEKAANLRPEVQSLTEEILGFVKAANVSSRMPGGIPGLGIKLGGLPSGSGFAAGPVYRRSDLLHENLSFRASAIGSVKLYQRYDLGLTAPHLFADRLLLDFDSGYENDTSLNYYGEGPNSKKSGRSDYRMEKTTAGGTAAFLPFRHLRAGARGGYLWVNVGPGQDDRFVSTEKTYGPATTPGIDRQTDFLRGGPFAIFDYRDQPGAPHAGGFYSAEYDFFSDRKLGINNFRLFQAEGQHYIPAFHKTHTIALRAKTALSFTDPGQVVPFYLQPVLDGSEMRGFRPYRFYDDNLLVFNGEYRWMIFNGLEAAIFTDQGKVFHDRSQWNLHHLESSYGFGFRFLLSGATFMRIDTGFSREGFQIWLKFNDAF